MSRYRCFAEMWLQDITSNTEYYLTADTHHNYYLETYNQKNMNNELYKDINATNDFKDYFLELESMANHKLKKLYSTLNDTKNYHTRIGAGIYNTHLHVFAETFNYTIPELNEYYFFEYKNNTPLFSVYRKSEFMRSYLQQEKYNTIYGLNPNI